MMKQTIIQPKMSDIIAQTQIILTKTMSAVEIDIAEEKAVCGWTPEMIAEFLIEAQTDADEYEGIHEPYMYCY